MFRLNNKAAVPIGCLILAALLTPLSARADEWNLTTRFTVNQPFQVPGLSLKADTPYVIRLLDSPSTRNVVQIYNADQTHNAGASRRRSCTPFPVMSSSAWIPRRARQALTRASGDRVTWYRKASAAR
jgi:hypothetical protein